MSGNNTTNLKNNYNIVTLTKKKKCTQCETKLMDGRSVVVHKNDNGKIKAYLCSDICVKAYDGGSDGHQA